MVRPRAATTKSPSGPGEALLAWYDRSRRALPWRATPGEQPDPYAVWLSEIMLQQTTVATVKDYYAAFVARWPTVEALAAAPLDEALAAWAGLGYYARARNLHACAHLVAREHGGRFPRDEETLLRLPGVGPYTAAAIAAIAFDQPTVAVDGNVERVMARLYALETPPREAKALIREKAADMLVHSRPGDFAQALMDLGATICTPRAPDCGACPLAPSCAAKASGAQALYPVKAAKPQKPQRRGAIFILRRGDDVLLIRRPAKGLFGGMAVFPSTPLHEDTPPQLMRDHAPRRLTWRAVDPPVAHVFTHFKLEATVFVAQTTGSDTPKEAFFTPCAALGSQGLPTLMRKAALRGGLAME